MSGSDYTSEVLDGSPSAGGPGSAGGSGPGSAGGSGPGSAGGSGPGSAGGAGPGSGGGPASLRAGQVAQTRAALVAAGRVLFGRDGFAATSVEDLAREARVTTGALYHHFPTKAKLFEAEFLTAHDELMAAAADAAAGAPDEVESL